jgi:hypothetical protein
LPWKKLRNVFFEFFFKFEQEKLRKTHFGVFIQRQKRKNGVEKKHGRWKEKNSKDSYWFEPP